MIKKFLSCLCGSLMVVGSANCVSPNAALEVPYKASIEYKINDMLNNKSNFMFSPFSIKSAFMLAINGGEGKTQEEMLETFGIENLEQYNLKMKAINKSLNESKIVDVSNSVWLNTSKLNTSIRFNKNYLKNIKQNFNADAYTVTKGNAVRSINSYVSKKTNGKINEIISTPDFLSVLINTIYFKSNWEVPFLKENTYNQNFTNKDGTYSETEFMHNKDDFNYFENNKMQLLEMKYKDSDLSMYIALSRNGETLTQEDIEYAIKNKRYKKVVVSIPKFKTESKFELSNVMKSLGIKKAFDDNCKDFNNIMFEGLGASSNVYISKVIHKTFIEVNESGTEASAATAIVMPMRSSCVYEPKTPKIFNADHPFTYIIKDNANDEILFMGQQSKF